LYQLRFKARLAFRRKSKPREELNMKEYWDYELEFAVSVAHGKYEQNARESLEHEILEIHLDTWIFSFGKIFIQSTVFLLRNDLLCSELLTN
jgi:hypothetical protein